jgi:ABC-type dipeptide/oligopeptide/nickel transport system permease subunit
MARESSDQTLTEGFLDEEVSSVSPLGLAWRRLVKKRIAMLALVFICVFYFFGLTAPLLTDAGIISSYRDQNLEQTLQSPSLHHPFGTDRLGRDQLSRVIWASQTTVIITVLTIVTGSLFIAVGLGLLSGYVGGWVDALIMRIGDTFASLPTLLMLILINATLGDRVRGWAGDVEDFTGIGGIVQHGVADYFLVFAALSAFSWVGLARILRSQVLALRETEFILAARMVGASTRRIMFRHLLPNVSNVIIVSVSLALAGIAGSELVLTWFGVGIKPPNPSFGAMIFEASSVRTVNEYPYLLAFPGGIVAGLLFSFNLLGDALTDVFTPRAR